MGIDTRQGICQDLTKFSEGYLFKVIQKRMYSFVLLLVNISYASSEVTGSYATNQARHRQMLYGYDDCSDADSIARSYNGCGIPVPAFSCESLNDGGKTCDEKCNNEERCDFFSIIFDSKKSTCKCSMRTAASLIASTRVTLTDNDGAADCVKGMATFVCDMNHLIDKRVQKLENCDGEFGCAYDTSKGFTVAKVADDWSMIDTCKIRVSPNLRSKAKRDRMTGGHGEGWDPESSAVDDREDVKDNIVYEGVNTKGRGLTELLTGNFARLNEKDYGPGLFGFAGEKPEEKKSDIRKSKFPSIKAKKLKAKEDKEHKAQAYPQAAVSKEIVHNVTANEKFTSVTGDIHEVITADFTDVITFGQYTGSEKTWYNTGTDNGCPAGCPCKCKKKGTCDCEVEVDIEVEAVIDVNMPDCSDKDKEDCGGGCNGKKFKSD